MNANKISLILILTLLFSCSSDNVVNEDTVQSDLRTDSKSVSSSRGSGEFVKLPANPIKIFVEYAEGTSEEAKKAVRDRQKDFLGLVAYYEYDAKEQVECTTCFGTNTDDITGDVEVWIVKEDVYNAPCPTCRCCKSESSDDEEDDVNRMQVAIIKPCREQI